MTKTPLRTHCLPVLEKPVVQLGFSHRSLTGSVQQGGVTKILWDPKGQAENTASTADHQNF